MYRREPPSVAAPAALVCRFSISHAKSPVILSEAKDLSFARGPRFLAALGGRAATSWLCISISTAHYAEAGVMILLHPRSSGIMALKSVVNRGDGLNGVMHRIVPRTGGRMKAVMLGIVTVAGIAATLSGAPARAQLDGGAVRATNSPPTTNAPAADSDRHAGNRVSTHRRVHHATSGAAATNSTPSAPPGRHIRGRFNGQGTGAPNRN